MTDPLGLINNNNAANALPGRPLRPAGPGDQPNAQFKDVLMKNIEQVNRLQQDADMAIEDYYSGKRDDVDAVMTAAKKADMAFKMLLQVRNKMVDAYEEIKQIRV